MILAAEKTKTAPYKKKSSIVVINKYTQKKQFYFYTELCFTQFFFRKMRLSTFSVDSTDLLDVTMSPAAENSLSL